MFQFLNLLLRRLLVFALVVSLALFTVFELFPYIEDRTPTLIAVLVTYLILAYALIPALFRIMRVFDKPNHIPTCAITSDGWKSDPVNIAILAKSKRDFLWAMQKAGWQVADSKTPKTILKTLVAVMLNKSYPTAPFSDLYLFGRKQDIGLEIEVDGSPRKRHHVRFWRVNQSSLMTGDEHEHHGFWRKLFKQFWPKEQSLWVGACLFDSGALAILWRNGQINHRNNPDADYEREFMIETMQQAGVLKNITDIKAGEPYRGRGQNLGLTIISDGYVRLCQLKRQILPPTKK